MTLGKMALSKMAGWAKWHWIKWHWVNCPDTGPCIVGKSDKGTIILIDNFVIIQRLSFVVAKN